MHVRFPALATFTLAALFVSGCASDQLLGPNSGVTTSALTQPAANPACVSLASQIDALRAEGVADKIEKAAAKKYKMKPADLTKADQLTKANAEFQTKCSTLPARPAVTAQPGTAGPPAPGAAAKPASPSTARAPAAGPPVTTLSASSGAAAKQP